MSKYIPGPPDSSMVLQAAVTKTTDFNGAWFDLGEGFAPGGLGLPVGAVVSTTAIDATTGDETYAFKMQQADHDRRHRCNARRDCHRLGRREGIGYVSLYAARSRRRRNDAKHRLLCQPEPVA
jgi:hypothetical protein